MGTSVKLEDSEQVWSKGHLFQVHFAPSHEAIKSPLMDNMKSGKNRLGDDVKRLYRESSDMGKVVAEYGAKRMSKLLSKDHQFHVGATGKASENIEYGRTQVQNGLWVWAVWEGSKTQANYAIRHGVAPKTSKADYQGDLAEWASAKGLRMQNPNKYRKADALARKQASSKGDAKEAMDRKIEKDKPGSTLEINLEGKGKKTGGRGKNVRTRALFAIMRALQNGGTNRLPDGKRKGAHWMELYPKGSPRFDYVAYSFVTEEGYRTKMSDIGGQFLDKICIPYITTGKRGSGQLNSFSK